MTEANWITAGISGFSAVIALIALVTSRRTQRATYQLQLQADQRKARLKAVEVLGRDKRKRIGFGFKILNGPDEVTISDAKINITYKVYRDAAILRHDILIRLVVRSDEFRVLGITGKPFGFRLIPNDEVEWRFPFSVTHYLPEIAAENDNDTGRRQKIPVIELIFSVTASGNVKSCEEPLLLGGFVGGKTLLGFFERNITTTLKDIILGTLAKDALQTIGTMDPAVREELKDLARRGHNIPAGLLKWLVDTWEQTGSFSDESTEMLARYLIRLRPPSPDPILLASIALPEQPSTEQQPEQPPTTPTAPTAPTAVPRSN